MTDPSTDANRKLPSRTWQMLGAVVAANAIFNVFVSERHKDEWIAPIVIGVFIAQPVLFGTWAAIGPPPAIKRLPLAIAALIVVGMASGLRSYLDSANPDYLELLCVMLSLFIASLIIWCVVQIFSHWTVTRPFAESDIVRSQFSLKYAIALTTVVALLLGFGRMLASVDPSPGHFTLIDFVKYAAVPIGVMLLAMLPSVAVPLLILSRPPGIRSIVLIVLMWSLMSFFAVQQLAILDRESWTEAAREVLGFQLGAAIAGGVTAVLLRLAGYRLLSRRSHVVET